MSLAQLLLLTGFSGVFDALETDHAVSVLRGRLRNIAYSFFVV